MNIALLRERSGQARRALREDADLHHIDSEAVVRLVLGCERGLGVVHRERQGIRVRYDKGENGGQRAGAEGERACGGGGRLKRLANECGAEKDTHKKGASAVVSEEGLFKKLLRTELSSPPRAKKEL